MMIDDWAMVARMNADTADALIEAHAEQVARLKARCCEMERSIDLGNALVEVHAARVAKLQEQSDARGMEIERLDRRVAELVMLALDGEREIAEARAEANNLRSQLREVEERLTIAERDLDQAGAETMRDADALDEELLEAWDAATEGRDIGGPALERLRAAICAVRGRLAGVSRG